MNGWEAYAQDISSGKIPACEPVKLAVARYYQDLENSLYTFDEQKVKRVIEFSKHCRHATGNLRGQPMKLEPWQQFILACIFGFLIKDTGLRKYRAAYVEIPRKSGKSSLAAIIAAWFLLCEKGQQDIFTAAVSRDQARIVFDAAAQMISLSPTLRRRVRRFQHHIIEPKTNSCIKPLAAKSKTIEGTNPSLAIIDEYHLHPDNTVYSALSLGMGARPNALLFAITTAGTDTLSACMEQNQYVRRVLENNIDDPS